MFNYRTITLFRGLFRAAARNYTIQPIKMLDLIPKVPLDSPEGQQLLKETPIKQTLLIRLSESNKQKHDYFCGLASAAHVMSAHHLAQKNPDRSTHDHCDIADVRYTEGNIFEFKETLSAIGTLEFIVKREEGVSLDEIGKLLKMHRHHVLLKRGDESNVDDFRCLAKEALSNVTSGVILNFHHNSKVDWGHFSPLAAFHEKLDRFLIMDTRHDHPYVWVTASDLYPLINTMDSFTKQYRGFLTASIDM